MAGLSGGRQFVRKGDQRLKPDRPSGPGTSGRDGEGHCPLRVRRWGWRSPCRVVATGQACACHVFLGTTGWHRQEDAGTPSTGHGGGEVIHSNTTPLL